MACSRRRELELKRKFSATKNCQDPFEVIRAHCYSNGITGLKSLTRAFKRADKDKNGVLNYKEFKNVIYRANITLDENILKAAFVKLDWSQDGLLSTEEALVALRPPMSDHRRQLIRNAFRKLDKDHSGEVTVDDLRGVFQCKQHPKYLNGEWSEDRVLREFLNTFDTKDKDGKITEDEFTDYYHALSASIDSDAYFDLVMRQAWKL